MQLLLMDVLGHIDTTIKNILSNICILFFELAKAVLAKKPCNA